MQANGRPIGSMDTLIAAQAPVRDLTLITHNAGEFARVGLLRVLEL
jgi:tRNA(fMet)-specific endonuclease VapC